MNEKLLDYYKEQGIAITLSDGQLGIEAYDDVLTPEIKQGIKDRKQQLLGELWLVRMNEAQTDDEVFKILEEYRLLDWTDDQRLEMTVAYHDVLERYYTTHPDDWMVGGRPATPRERVQLEKHNRGWFSMVPALRISRRSTPRRKQDADI